MKKIFFLLWIFAIVKSSKGQTGFVNSINRIDSFNTYFLNSFYKDICTASKIWKTVSTSVDINLYKAALTDVSDSLFLFENQYSSQSELMNEDMFFKFFAISKEIDQYKPKMIGAYTTTISQTDYDNLKNRFLKDFNIFQTNADNWIANPTTYKKEISDYNDTLFKYLTDSVFLRNNSLFSHYSIFYSITSHVIKQLLPKNICNNQLKELLTKVKKYSEGSNPQSIYSLFTKLTDKSTFLLNKYPTPWVDKDITVMPRAVVWLGNPSNIIWVFRSFGLYSGTIYNGFNYDRMHYFCTEFRGLPCRSETTTYDRAGIEWDYRCNQRWKEEVGYLEAEALKKSLNEESSLFNLTNSRSGDLKKLIDYLVASFNKP